MKYDQIRRVAFHITLIIMITRGARLLLLMIYMGQLSSRRHFFYVYPLCVAFLLLLAHFTFKLVPKCKSLKRNEYLVYLIVPLLWVPVLAVLYVQYDNNDWEGFDYWVAMERQFLLMVLLLTFKSFKIQISVLVTAYILCSIQYLRSKESWIFQLGVLGVVMSLVWILAMSEHFQREDFSEVL